MKATDFPSSPPASGSRFPAGSDNGCGERAELGHKAHRILNDRLFERGLAAIDVEFG
jgi:hypothetical protein